MSTNYNILKRRVLDSILAGNFNFDRKLHYFFFFKNLACSLSTPISCNYLIYCFIKITYLLSIFLLLLQRLYFHPSSTISFLLQFSFPFYFISPILFLRHQHLNYVNKHYPCCEYLDCSVGHISAEHGLVC